MSSTTGVEIGIDSTLMPPTIGGDTYEYYDDGRDKQVVLNVARENDLPLGDVSFQLIAIIAAALALAYLAIDAGGVVPFSTGQW